MEKDFFYNERFFVLRTMFEHEIIVEDEKYIGLSQIDISKITNIGLNKVNSIIKELKQNNYIENSKYKPQKLSITNKGYNIIKELK